MTVRSLRMCVLSRVSDLLAPNYEYYYFIRKRDQSTAPLPVGFHLFCFCCSHVVLGIKARALSMQTMHFLDTIFCIPQPSSFR